ncbi:MAG: hypothetical protein ABIM74_02885 [candidate division WOR-3 bacterium]
MEKVEKGLALIREGKSEEFAKYLSQMRKADPLVAELLIVGEMVYTRPSSEAIRHATRLLARVSDKPDLAVYLFAWLGIAHRMMGEMGASDNYFAREVETAEAMGNPNRAFKARLDLLYNKFMRAEFDSLYRDIQELAQRDSASDDYDIQYMLGALETTMGRPKKAVEILKAFLSRGNITPIQNATLKEVLGFALRMSGNLEEAYRAYAEATQELLALNFAYSAFPCAKAMELSRLKGMPPLPRDTIRKCINLAKSASWGELAASSEIEALLAEDDAEASVMLFEAAQSYHKAYQTIEAVSAGAAAAYLAWVSDAPIFTKILKFLGPILFLYPRFREDPILGDFISVIQPLMEKETKAPRVQGIEAYLIGDLRLFVNGKAISLDSWGRKDAIRCLVYLLLSPKHRIPDDHLFYLLWPNKKYTHKTRRWLYNLITIIRKKLGNPNLMGKKGDFYYLRDTWTDLGEIENLIRRADSSQNPTEREELIARARELASGELLPDFIYDSHVDEYRQYYERMRKRLLSYGE